MKYIIDVEDKPFTNGDGEVYRVKGFRSLFFDENGLDKLMPLHISKEIKDLESQLNTVKATRDAQTLQIEKLNGQIEILKELINKRIMRGGTFDE